MSNYSNSFFNAENENHSWTKVYNLIKAGSTVLDIGCSSGNFGQVLVERKKCVVDGVEPDKGDAKLAAKKLREVYVLNIETDSLKPITDKYDYLYFGDVIEHLAWPVETLKRVKPLLKKTGAIIFSIPNMGHVGVRLDLLEGRLQATETGLLDKTHLHFYTQEEVLRVFEEAGYSINHLEFVKKDYPKELLRQHLKKLGLTANDKFYKLLQKTDASAFQFVGQAVPSKIKKHKLPNFGPIDMFEIFYEDTKKNYETEIDRLKQENKVLTYKLQHPYRSAAAKVKRKIKR